MKLNQGQQDIYNLIVEGHNVAVLDSPGGTGKSYLLRRLQEDFGHETLFLSTTGVSAIAIHGMTFHSAMSLPLGYPTPKDLRTVSEKTQKLFSGDAVKRIVIDEAGMITTNMWYTFIKRLERFNKKSRNRDARNIQVVLFGDLLQLGSINNGKDYDLSMEHFGTDKYFKMQEFKDMNFKFRDLLISERHSNPEMKKMLDYIRKGDNLTEAVNYFNSKCYRYPLPKDVSILTTTNKNVDMYNNRVFNSNPNPAATIRAAIKGSFEEKEYPCESVLRLKVGLRVMCLRNDPEERWVNGSTGVITDLSPLGVAVKLDRTGDTHIIEPVEYEKYDYTTIKNEEGVEELTRFVDATFEQIPLRQCDAISVHKSQGSTLQEAIIDLSTGAGWATGLTYVALSRLTTIDGLYLKRKIKLDDIKVCEVTLDWLENRD